MNWDSRYVEDVPPMEAFDRCLRESVYWQEHAMASAPARSEVSCLLLRCVLVLLIPEYTPPSVTETPFAEEC